jgi:ATP-binding cassette, subfamily B, bacterial PglK
MIDSCVIIWKLMRGADRVQGIKATTAMLASSFLDVVTIMMAYPLIILLSSRERFLELIYKINSYEVVILDIEDHINFIQLALISAAIFLAILSFFARSFTHRAYLNFTFHFGERLKNDLFKALLNADLSTINKTHSSGVVAAISNRIDSVAFNVIMQIMIFLNALIFIVTLLLAGIFANPTVIVVIASLVCPIYFIFIRATKNKVSFNSLIISQETENAIKTVAESYRCYKEIKVDGIDSFVLSRFQSSSAKLRSAQAGNQLLAAVPKYLIESLILIALASIAYYSLLNAPSLSSTGLIATFGAASVAFLRIIPYAHALYAANTTIRATKDQLISLEATLANFLIQNKNHSQSCSAVAPAQLQTALVEEKLVVKTVKDNEFLTLKNVDIEESNTQTILLKNINLKLYLGDWVLITGPSGSGKTTFIDAVIGFRNIKNGEVLIKGVRKSTKTLLSEYCKVGYVTQGVFLFSDTVINNITLCFEDSGPEVRSSVAKLLLSVGLVDTVIEAYSFMDKNVGENGVNISGGQKQRIAICRALYKSPELLVLDEGTGALDKVTEEKVFDSIKSNFPETVVIAISHNNRHTCFNKHYDFLMQMLVPKHA